MRHYCYISGAGSEFLPGDGDRCACPSFGTAHGIYKAKPMLDLERVRIIAEKTGLPLVMHGGSGVSEEDYRRAIRAGMCHGDVSTDTLCRDVSWGVRPLDIKQGDYLCS